MSNGKLSASNVTDAHRMVSGKNIQIFPLMALSISSMRTMILHLWTAERKIVKLSEDFEGNC